MLSGDFLLKSGDREKSSKSGVSRRNREIWQVCARCDWSFIMLWKLWAEFLAKHFAKCEYVSRNDENYCTAVKTLWAKKSSKRHFSCFWFSASYIFLHDYWWTTKNMTKIHRCVARIWKRGGGLFWKSETTVSDLDPNFHCSWIRFKRFIRNWDGFFGRNRKF